jgi:hypothetical protein
MPHHPPLFCLSTTGGMKCCGSFQFFIKGDEASSRLLYGTCGRKKQGHLQHDEGFTYQEVFHKVFADILQISSAAYPGFFF